MRVKLSDVCERGSSNLKQSDVIDKSGDYPIYGAAGYIGNVDFYHQEKEYVAVVKDGAGIGRTTLHPAKSSVIGTMQYLIPKDNVRPEYLCYVVQYMHLEKYFTGATIPHIYFKDYKNEEFNLDNLDKQAKIVSILEKVETIIAKHKQELQKLDDLIKARFVEMFGTLHDNENGFDVVTINDVCTMIKDGTHQTPQYTENKIDGYKFLSSKDVMSQKIDWTDIKYIPAELHEKLYAAIKPQRNDILMSKNGVNYGVAAVNDTDEVFDIYVSLALLRPRKVIDPVFFRCVINNSETKRQFDSSIKGIGVPNLHLGEIKKTRIILPPMELQREFVTFVAQVDKSKVAVQKALDETQLLFDSLMQEYFG
jgi:type I restriction enzyme S subunit